MELIDKRANELRRKQTSTMFITNCVSLHNKTDQKNIMFNQIKNMVTKLKKINEKSVAVGGPEGYVRMCQDLANNRKKFENTIDQLENRHQQAVFATLRD